MNGLQTRTEYVVVPRQDLGGGLRDEMFALLNDHFEGITRERFEIDLSEKNYVILLRRDDRLVGFSTLLAYETSYASERVSVIYSGDTIVTPAAWGTTALPRAWISAVNELRAAYPRGHYYWLLLTSGFRTYRFLPLFWRDFLPRFDAVEKPETRELLNHLASEKFGAQFNSRTGIVRFTHPQQLCSGLSGIAPERFTDPHVRFFATRNPSHERGDELVCLTELSPKNLTDAGRRIVRDHEHVCHTR
jgi:hypothetical protein